MHTEVWEALGQKISENMTYKCIVSWNLLQLYTYEDMNLVMMKKCTSYHGKLLFQ